MFGTLSDKLNLMLGIFSDKRPRRSKRGFRNIWVRLEIFGYYISYKGRCDMKLEKLRTALARIENFQKE